PAGEDSLGWHPLSDLLLCRACAVDLLRKRSHSIFKQSGRKLEPHHEGLLPSADYPDLCCSVRSHRLSDRVCGVDCDDALLRSRSDDQRFVVATAFVTRIDKLAWSWTVALGVERRVSRRASRVAVCCAVLDVCNSDRVSEHIAWRTVANGVRL